ncbi:MAG: cell division protein ZapA [Spirosomataceae bacterium]
MESDKKEVVNLILDDKLVPFIVRGDLESYYRTAGELFNNRLAVLKNKYSGLASSNDILIHALAIEALVDALQADHNYLHLKNAMTKKLNEHTAADQQSHDNLVV